jgi:hypothetical protein
MSDHDETVLGRVTWLTSDEQDGGPDVGMILGLGDGQSLYIGEITIARWLTGGPKVAALGSDSGWWMAIYPAGTPLAKFADTEAAQTFFDAITKAVDG